MPVFKDFKPYVTTCKCGCKKPVVIRSPYHSGYSKVCSARLHNGISAEDKAANKMNVPHGNAGGCLICPKLDECRSILGEMRVWGGRLQVRALLCQPRKWTDLVFVGGSNVKLERTHQDALG